MVPAEGKECLPHFNWSLQGEKGGRGGGGRQKRVKERKKQGRKEGKTNGKKCQASDSENFNADKKYITFFSLFSE